MFIENQNSIFECDATLMTVHWKEYSLNLLLNFFKVSGCNQFILATFNKKQYVGTQSTKCVCLNVAKINWLQPLTLKLYCQFN